MNPWSYVQQIRPELSLRPKVSRLPNGQSRIVSHPTWCSRCWVGAKSVYGVRPIRSRSSWVLRPEKFVLTRRRPLSSTVLWREARDEKSYRLFGIYRFKTYAVWGRRAKKEKSYKKATNSHLFRCFQFLPHLIAKQGHRGQGCQFT
ncbi:hypothetical protein EMIT0P228_20123 [Pseudomonas brassicacearum]